MAGSPVAVEGLAGLQGALLACPGQPAWGQQGTASLGSTRPLSQASPRRVTAPGFTSSLLFHLLQSLLPALQQEENKEMLI